MQDPQSNDLLARAKDEVAGMAREGMAHPGTKPLLVAAAIGGVAGAILPVVSLPLGVVAGAGFAIWNRIKR